MDKLQLSRDEFTKKPGTAELQPYGVVEDQDWLDKSGNVQKNKIVLRGVSFVRQIDGIAFTGRGGDGGFNITFGPEAKVANMEIIWRNFRRHKSFGVLSPDAIVERVKRGQTKLVPTFPFELGNATTLSITNAVACYLGESGDARQDFMYPYAALECRLDVGEKPTSIMLKCPVLLE